jgi:hypothetical protein
LLLQLFITPFLLHIICFHTICRDGDAIIFLAACFPSRIHAPEQFLEGADLAWIEFLGHTSPHHVLPTL